MADAISIEETNRIRASLGMKPLAVPGAAGPIFKQAPSAPVEDAGSTLESRQAEGYDNYRKLQEAEETKRKREAKAEAIKRARDTAKRFAKLEGKGLGEADDDGDLDAKAWLMKQKKRQKEIEKARKKEQELAEAEAAAAAEYTAKDLAGVRVGHELDTFIEGEDQVLTLKDTTIDENEEEGDELENLDLREREKLSDKLELKKKKPVYNPNDDDDSGDRKILAQYDEEIDGKRGKRFTLDGMGSTTEAATVNSASTSKSKAKTFSLDILKDDEPKSDYLDISDIKVRKPKKKKAKSTRQKAVDEDDVFPESEPAASNGDNADAMDVDQGSKPIVKKRTFEDMSFVDDDDLQALLATQRRNALKKRQKLRPEDFAQRLRDEASATPADNEEGNDSGLVIDETSEFVANLQKPVAPEPKKRSVSRPDAVTSMGADSDDDGDVQMNESYANIEDDEDRLARIKREEETKDAIANNGLEEEATLEKGLGSTLKLLRERGILKTSESGDVATIFREKQMFLAEKQRREAEAERRAKAQRERDRTTGRLDRMSARDREEHARQQNTMRDQQESRQLAEHFNKEYKPNVELKYVDEYGRNMNQKEAFKHLSHQFHGKGSGKQKTEKLLKKIEDEKRREAQSSLDGSQIGGMTGAAAQQLKKNRQAGVRLA
ncbi:putative dna binding protein sart-1 protein [Botrytis fragariae]|uniref:Putative dna binding protein sart-1 protein n=1 Tax=Botrytis fragariae TaxID=1964551 RepID=A0A8H6ALR6_9HELO|nr:putative dna binding protein sart-1 protein [Botrytis fragariae]KAF5869676.1 putative dna binding protein sart-1 protein [Botrytis fragariae]